MSTESKLVEITLNRETRLVRVERYSPAHCWFIADNTVVFYRFRTGQKLHHIPRPQVKETTRGWKLCAEHYYGKQVQPIKFGAVVASAAPSASDIRDERFIGKWK